MKKLEELNILGVCQSIKMDVDTLHGLIKCNPELKTSQDLMDLAEKLSLAAGKARQVAYGLGDKELYYSLEKSSYKLMALIEGE